MNNKFFLNLATLGPIGYFPAPGTCGTLATIPLVFLLQQWLGTGIAYALFTCAFTLVSIFIITKALTVLRNSHGNDPQQIILDEVVGCLIVFAWIPLSLNTFSLGILLFRALDIFKPGPISWIEQLPGAWGNVADDVLAALVSNLIVYSLIAAC
jgi:phosphatidylglycerophosphatase A